MREDEGVAEASAGGGDGEGNERRCGMKEKGRKREASDPKVSLGDEFKQSKRKEKGMGLPGVKGCI